MSKKNERLKQKNTVEKYKNKNSKRRAGRRRTMEEQISRFGYECVCVCVLYINIPAAKSVTHHWTFFKYIARSTYCVCPCAHACKNKKKIKPPKYKFISILVNSFIG